MKQESAERLADHLPDVEIYEDYSGRGMYGKTTTGIVVPSLLGVMHALGQSVEYLTKDKDFNELELLAKAMQDMRSTDNMGRDRIIIY